MDKIFTPDDIRKLELDEIKKHGDDYSLLLMEKAGCGLFNTIKEFNEPFLIVCGKGNNAGDGIVAARYLFEAGKKVSLALLYDEEEFSHDSKINYHKIKNKIEHHIITKSAQSTLHEYINDSNTIIDCILGTGSKGELCHYLQHIINQINHSKKLGKKIIACDIPTGLDATNGSVLNTCIEADTTVTFGYKKLGLVLYPGKELCGDIRIINIGLPNTDSKIFLLDEKYIKENLPARKVDSNKGTFGKTLLVCGSKKYPGAAILSSNAAVSIGSGLTALSSPEEVFTQITPAIPEVIHVDFTCEAILKEASNSNIIIIGPGLTTSKEVKLLVENLIPELNIPIILDADGINILENNSKILERAKSKVVLTPHPKEFSRLINIPLDIVLKDRFNLVKDFSLKHKCTVLLKGAGSIISTFENEIYISPYGNSALAKGGTGDVLTGFIGGLISQGISINKAVCLAVMIHGKCAETISKEKSEYSLFPQDLIGYLPKVLIKI